VIRRSAPYSGRVRRPQLRLSATSLLLAASVVVGLALAIANGDTWQRVLATSALYGGVAALLLTVVTLRPDRRRVEKPRTQNVLADN
jgi:F0F1-type ATP synthase assembly protein I